MPMRKNAFCVRRAGLAVILVALVVAGGTTGCLNSDAQVDGGRSTATFDGEYPFLVVCTTGMVADVVVNVGGDHVQVLEAGGVKLDKGGDHVRVVQMMGEGVDPHLYKASPGDLSLIDRADVIFYSGLHLEGKLADVFVRMARRKPTVAVTEKLDMTADERLLEVEDGFYDPHVWFDVSLWSETVDVVAEELARFDPDHAGDYRANAKTYRAELAELHQHCRERIAVIPEGRRVLVTAHDAFHYFGRAYGLQVKAIQGISTDSEASAKHIEDLVEFIVSRRIKAVFVESSVSDRNIRLLIDGCRARGHTVTVGGELFSDAMGKPGTEEGTYVGMVRHNVETIVRALQ